MPLHSAVRKHSVRVRESQFDLIIELASDTQALVPASSMRVGVDDLERVFGNAEVQMAVVAAPDLRYLYVNAAYRNIRPEVPMVGRTYAEVFPGAAAGWLPNREVPAWWQGECVPISVGGLGYPDAALILIWDVTQRHVPEAGPLAKSETRVRIESAWRFRGSRPDRPSREAKPGARLSRARWRAGRPGTSTHAAGLCRRRCP